VMRWIAVGEMHVLGLCGLRSVSKKSKGIFRFTIAWLDDYGQSAKWLEVAFIPIGRKLL